MNKVGSSNIFEYIRSHCQSLVLILVPFALFFSTLQSAEAHAYSAGYSTINVLKSETTFTFALDEVSVIELTHGDTNNNGMLDEKEFEAVKGKIESIIKDNIQLKINGQPVEWSKLDSISLDRKGDATQLIVKAIYPAVTSSQSISLTDNLYLGTKSTTNYVDLLKINYGNENSTAALSDNNRTWSMILSENDYANLKTTNQGSEKITKQTPSNNVSKEQSKTDSGWITFIKLGMHHILSGYDHLLFLLSLLIARQSFKQIVKVITAFTVAHSLTLTLTVLGFISVPSSIVEPAIALSICYVALENIFRKKISKRWMITFLFGLIHGMGFADLLTSMQIPKSELAIDLASFNIGIEIIQLLIVIPLLPLLTLLYRWKHSRYAMYSISGVAFLLGGAWLIERLFF